MFNHYELIEKEQQAKQAGWSAVQWNHIDGIIGIPPNSKTGRFEVYTNHLVDLYEDDSIHGKTANI